SLLASIFYLVISSMFRFQIPITQQLVNIGYGITIGALTLNILFLTFWLYHEWSVRHPHPEEFLDEAAEARTTVFAKTDSLSALPPGSQSDPSVALLNQ